MKRFIAAFGECEDSGGRLKFCGVKKAALDVLKIFDLSDMFEMYEREEDAIKALKE